MKRFATLLMIICLVVPVGAVLAACGGDADLEGEYKFDSVYLADVHFYASDFEIENSAIKGLTSSGEAKVTRVYNALTAEERAEIAGVGEFTEEEIRSQIVIGVTTGAGIYRSIEFELKTVGEGENAVTNYTVDGDKVTYIGENEIVRSMMEGEDNAAMPFTWNKRRGTLGLEFGDRAGVVFKRVAPISDVT